MKKMIAVSGLIFVLAALSVIGIAGYILRPDYLTVQQIRTEAQNSVTLEQCDEVPATKQTKTIVTKKVCTNVLPQCNWWTLCLPQNVCENVQSVATKVINLPEAEKAAYQLICEKVDEENEQRTLMQIKLVAENQRQKFKTFIDDMLKISAGIVALFAALAGLLYGANRQSTA